MKLSQSVIYAVCAYLQLAAETSGSPVSCRQIAGDGNMPQRYLLQILRELARQGIVRSIRGGGGGFKLLRGPQETSLLDLIEAVEGPLLVELPEGAGLSEESEARLRESLGQITGDLRRQLHAVKLSYLMSVLPGSQEAARGSVRPAAHAPPYHFNDKHVGLVSADVASN
ncbi:MAG: RrF2 family transcriptional regulator [Planctomycetota bacterium]